MTGCKIVVRKNSLEKMNLIFRVHPFPGEVKACSVHRSMLFFFITYSNLIDKNNLAFELDYHKACERCGLLLVIVVESTMSNSL